MSDTDEIKARLNVVDIVGERVTLKKAGRNFKGLCPFHSEKTPSFVVSPDRQTFHCFGCFPPGEFVKTPFGYHQIENLDTKHWVVSGSGHLRRIERVMVRDYRGDLIKVHTKKLRYPVRMTSDHQVFSVIHNESYKSFLKKFRSPRFLSSIKQRKKIHSRYPIQQISAEELKIGDLLLYPINSRLKDIEYLNIQDYIPQPSRYGPQVKSIPYLLPLTDKLLKFIGYYIAEGSSHRAYVRFSLSDDEVDFAQEIRFLARKIFGLTSSIHRRKGPKKSSLEITICHAQLAHAFDSLCGKGAENKHVPWVLQDISPKKQQIILAAIYKGDGYTFRGNKSPNTHNSVTTVSRILSEQLTDILLRLRRFPSVWVGQPMTDDSGVHHKQVYKIFWSDTAKQKYDLIYSHKGIDYWMLPIEQLERIKYSGPVYNLTIDHDHSYIGSHFAVANCGKGGDIFTFVMELDRIDFTESLETLAERAGVKLTRRPADTPEAKLKQQILEANHLASEYYQYLLTKHTVGEHARLYFKNRGISDKSVKTFALGYSPNDWDGLYGFLKKKGYEPELLEKAGLILKGGRGYYDRFRGRVMFTLKDHRGNVVGFSGRVFDPPSHKASEGQEKAKYINTSETPVYIKGNVLYALDVTKAAIQKENEAILMEGELDVISSFQAGISNVTAIKGSALTENHARLLRRFTERLIFALDSDIAGDQAARRGIELAEKAGFDMRVLSLPSGKDPDEAVRESPGLFKKAVKDARPIYDYLLGSAVSRHGTVTSFGKKKIAEEYLPVLSRIDNPIVRGHYIRELSQAIRVPEETVREGLLRVAVRGGRAETAKTPDLPGRPSLSRLEKTELYALSLLLQGSTSLLLEKFRATVPDGSLYYRPVRAITGKLTEYMSGHPAFNVQEFAGTLPPELIAVFDEAFLWDISAILDDDTRFMREWQKTVREVRRLRLRKIMEDLSLTLRDLDADSDKYSTIQGELRDVSNALAALEKSA